MDQCLKEILVALFRKQIYIELEFTLKLTNVPQKGILNHYSFAALDHFYEFKISSFCWFVQTFLIIYCMPGIVIGA